MKRRLRLLTLAALVAALGACSSSDPSDEASTDPVAAEEPETRTITVQIVDELPLTVYYKHDETQCSSAAFLDLDRPPPEVTLADGSGTIIAALDGPRVGGTRSASGCSVPVIFRDVPASDVYVATVTGAAGDMADRTVQDNGSASQTIEVTI